MACFIVVFGMMAGFPFSSSWLVERKESGIGLERILRFALKYRDKSVRLADVSVLSGI
jgi:hypothetical protein